MDSVIDATDSAGVVAEVRAFLMEYFGAVERGDKAAFLSLFQAGEGLTVIEDSEVRNWRAFVGFVDEFFGMVDRIRLTLESCAVDALAPEIAVATGAFRGQGATKSGEPLSFRNAFTFVLSKATDTWHIRHVHESSLAA